MISKVLAYDSWVPAARFTTFNHVLCHSLRFSVCSGRAGVCSTYRGPFDPLPQPVELPPLDSAPPQWQ